MSVGGNYYSVPDTTRRSVVQGGRADVRTVLYMATVAAVRCKPVIRRFHQRLRAASKPANVALTICMRKLLGLLNTIPPDPNAMATQSRSTTQSFPRKGGGRSRWPNDVVGIAAAGAAFVR